MEEKIIYEAKITKWIFVRDAILMIIYIGFLMIIVDIINCIGTKLKVTNKKVYGKIGILHTKELDSPLNKINNINVEQNILGKILNFGTVKISTSSAIYDFKYICNPNEFKQVLNNQIEQFDNDRIKKQAEELARAMKK